MGIDEKSKKEFPKFTGDLERRLGERISTTPYIKEKDARVDAEYCKILFNGALGGSLGILYDIKKPGKIQYKTASIAWSILPPEMQTEISDEAIRLKYNARNFKRIDKYIELEFP